MLNPKKPSILVVDDEEGIRSLFTRFLNEEGHKVTVASSKHEALSMLEETEFDLLIVDKNLPDGSGIDIVTKVERLKHRSEVIIITGFSDIESTIEAIKHKVYRYLLKPIDLDLLIIEVAGALETQNLRRGLIHRTEELELFNVELSKSEKRFRQLAELLPGILIETDGRGALTFVNRSGLKMTGYDRGAFFDRYADHSLFVPEDRDRIVRAFERVLKGEEIPSNEYCLQCRDGSLMPVIARSSTVEQDGKVIGLRAILFDISEYKQAEKALREKEAQLQLAQKMEAIGALAGGVAHDFNNMLGAIKGYCDVVLHELHEGDPIRTDIVGIVEAADRAADLTRQLLAFGRKQILRSKILDLNEIIRAIEKMLARLIRENVELEVKLAPDLFYVYADSGQLEQVIMNLVVNARDAMPEGGRLVIETRNLPASDQAPAQPGSEPLEDQIVLSVTDTGVGIDEEILPRIFEPFFTTKEQRRGTGLGLATVYGIVKQSGGNMNVHSVPGQGTRFDIRLPRVEGTPGETGSLIPDAAFLGGQETILVVEDEKVLLELVGRMLRLYGYRVLEATSGANALLLSEQHSGPIDLLLTDVVMPRMSGPELARKLESTRPETTVLFMSGYSDTTLVGQLATTTTDCLLMKPFSAQKLATKVRNMLATKNP